MMMTVTLTMTQMMKSEERIVFETGADVRDGLKDCVG